ncbi:protein tyrosine phosphatase [Salinisphaera sp. T31B1]
MRIASAGIGAVEGGKMPAEAAAIAEREGLALDAHRGRQITTPILRDHELLLVMEQGQKRWLAERFPESRGRVFMVTHWRGEADIADPYRHDAAFFEQVFSELAEAVGDWVARLQPARTDRPTAG